MCTVSFLSWRDGFLLTTNRDERRERGVARPPEVFERQGLRMLAPIDADAGGTWILATETGLVLCLLNGSLGVNPALRADVPSRGLLLPTLALEGDARSMHRSLRGMHARGALVHNPFRLLVGNGACPDRVTRLSWDGGRVHREELRAPHLETSSGHDPELAHRRRGASFEQFLSTKWTDDALPNALSVWHRTHLDEAGVGDPLSVCMHHEAARTVSCTRVRVAAQQVAMTYWGGPPCEFPEAREQELRRRST